MPFPLFFPSCVPIRPLVTSSITFEHPEELAVVIGGNGGGATVASDDCMVFTPPRSVIDEKISAREKGHVKQPPVNQDASLSFLVCPMMLSQWERMVLGIQEDNSRSTKIPNMPLNGVCSQTLDGGEQGGG